MIVGSSSNISSANSVVYNAHYIQNPNNPTSIDDSYYGLISTNIVSSIAKSYIAAVVIFVITVTLAIVPALYVASNDVNNDDDLGIYLKEALNRSSNVTVCWPCQKKTPCCATVNNRTATCRKIAQVSQSIGLY